MAPRYLLLVLLGLCLGALAAAQEVSSGNLRAQFRQGVIVALRDSQGTVHAGAEQTRGLCALRTLTSDLTPQAAPASSAPLKLPASQELLGAAGAENGQLTLHLAAEAATGELVVEQSGRAAGVHSVQWGIAGIPLDHEIIVPGHSGLRFDRTAPLSYMQFNYPSSWECQFVIVQGPRGGFWVWADDATGRYKNLRLWKRDTGWDLAFESQNLAPFADRQAIRSVRWHLGLLTGSGQEAAVRYSRWAERTYGAVPVARQRPAWVKDIRALVICGLELDSLDQLAAVFDPRQTVLYAPDWRRDGYDRNYPDYTARPELGPFLEKAHRLGFRVMLHVNYFGCDPKHPLFAQFEPYQVRDPFSHKALWWTWPPKGEPDIKFAYINPASKAWRDLFVGRMKELCTQYPVDALHLDQTLCIWNADSGPVDGLTMLEGSLAEHRELREALPDVALSGEGLNEVTYRYEAFAQRHAYGLHHSEGTWSRDALRCAHPVSSVVLRPCTVINGYLGMTNPDNPQLYAAWQEAYTHWGVIPTLTRPTARGLANPQGFMRQLLAEVSFFQGERVDPDPLASWPEARAPGQPETRFAFRTASGDAVRYVGREGWELLASRAAGPPSVVSQTVTGTRSVTTSGHIPGWLAYDATRAFGLTPTQWYPLLPGAPDPDAFHVSALPEPLEVAGIMAGDDLAAISLRDPGSVIRVGDLLPQARCGDTVGGEITGPLASSPSGASCSLGAADVLYLHPPWKATRVNAQTGVTEANGLGEVWLRTRVKLPADSRPWLRSEAYMDEGAIGPGKTDGVTFTVEAEGKVKRQVSRHVTGVEPQPVDLDLREFAGQEITLRLSAGPGPKGQATFDWARWRAPRLELDRQSQGTLRIVSPQPWQTALSAAGSVPVRAVGPHTYELAGTFPGSIYLLNRTPQLIGLPGDLTKVPFLTSFVAEDGTLLHSPQYAAGIVTTNTVGGVSKPGFFAHPPNGGQTRLQFPLQLPANAQRLRLAVGLREGSKSDGCTFVVAVTGQEVARRTMQPGPWADLEVDLRPWAGKAIVLSLITDADGGYNYDWACWGEPRLE